MIGLLDGLKLAGGALLGGVVVYSYVQAFSLPAARMDERNVVAAEALVRTIETLKSREKTDVEISAGDASALCEHFGLQDDDRAECLRRLAEATAKP